MNTIFKNLCRTAALALAAAWFAGCEDYGPSDHKPADGMGAIIVNNNCGMTVDVFIDGADEGEIKTSHDRAFDRTPGVHRVVIQGHDDHSTFAGDVDVLEGQNTVIDLTGPITFTSDDNFSVDIWYQTP